MGLLGRALKGAQRASTLSTPSEDLIAAFGGQPSYSGKTVTVASSLTLVPVFSAINFLSSAVGALPLEVFRRIGPTKREMAPMGSRPWQLLHDRPNARMAADEMWTLIASHLLSWGNAFIWKERGEDGRVANLWPIDPRRVQVGLGPNLEPAFLVQTYAPTPPGDPYIEVGQVLVMGTDEILHIRGLSADGLVGYSPVQLAKNMLGGMMAQEEFEGRLWANDATPGVVLIHPNRLQPDATERLRQLWDSRHKGPTRARATAVLGEDIKVQQMTMPLTDAQFIETSKLHRTDVALMFNLPPSKLAGESGGSMTYSNTEQESMDLVKWSARRWMARIEGAVTWDSDLMPLNWFARFNANEILRGSMQERYAAYSTAPHLLVDEVREDDDLPPLPDGKGQVLAKTIAPPRGTTIPTQDEPLSDQPTPGQGAEPGDVPAVDDTQAPSKTAPDDKTTTGGANGAA